MLIAQITDCHIVEPGELVADRVDSAAGLVAALEQIAHLSPELIVATGDLVNEGTPAQYDRLQELLEAAPAPVIPLPGNHDDRAELRRRFADILPDGGPDDPIDHVVDRDGLRLVMLDTQVPGSIAGAFRPAQADWLDRQLSEAPERPTIVFQHHPPYETGIRFMDREAFVGGDLEAEVLRRHGHVELVSCGHVHRAVQRRFGGTIACTWPATSVSLDIGLIDNTIRYSTEPTGFAVHDWSPEAGLRSHLQPVGRHDRWTPSWAL